MVSYILLVVFTTVVSDVERYVFVFVFCLHCFTCAFAVATQSISLLITQETETATDGKYRWAPKVVDTLRPAGQSGSVLKNEDKVT